MKLISTKKTKRQIALMFVFAFTLSNLLSLIGPSAKAAVTITAPSAGTCFQHTGTAASGALVTVYAVGNIQVQLTAGEVNPSNDAADDDNGTATARATNVGSVSTNGDTIGNVFTIVPPTGTNFVIVPGFQDSSANNLANQLATTNATISNAIGTADTGGADNNLGISAGVVTTGTAGTGRVIVAIVKDHLDTYPKSGTSSNTVTISLTGLGLVVPPSGDASLSGTLQASFDGTPPSGIGTNGGNGNPAIAAAIPGLTGTINLCTITSPSGKIEVVSDSDDDTADLYDKTATATNLLALSQIGSFTSVVAQDTGTNAATPVVDLEPILIRGNTSTNGSNNFSTTDQVFATGELLSDIDTGAEAPSTSGLDLATTFGNSTVAPITITFSDDNATATSTLNGVDLIIESSTAPMTAAGFSGTQSSRHGFLGALRAATLGAGGNTASLTAFFAGTTWGVASISGGGNADGLAIQETNNAAATGTALSTLMGKNGNATEPFNDTFVDLRIVCEGVAPVAGWFAVANSVPVDFGTTITAKQKIAASQAGSKLLVNGANFYTQNLTNISGTTPGGTVNEPLPFLGGSQVMTAADTVLLNNALLYATCTMNTVTILPIQNGFDGVRDVLAITPKITVANISNTFSSDVNLIAQVSGNNISGTSTLNLTKLLGAVTSSGGGTSTLAAATGVGLSEASQLGVSCSSGGQSSVVLNTISGSNGSVAAQVAASCTSGSVASAPAFFTGGSPASVSGTTVIDGSPVVQGEGRGVLITESSATGFNELAAKIGGGTQGLVIEVQLPTGCDVIDDLDNSNTAVSTTAGSGGNDVTRITSDTSVSAVGQTSLTSTAGITVGTTAMGSGDAALTNSNILVPASGSEPAKVHFGFTSATGTGTDASTIDSVLLKLDAQDIFCPSTIADDTDLTAKVVAQNKVSSPTVTEVLGSSVSLGKAKKAITFSFADDVATSTKGEVSTNTNIGGAPRLTTGGVTTTNPFKIVENDERSIPLGGRVSARNLDPDNTVVQTILSMGQLWVIPADGSAFTTAPAASDVSFSDTTITLDGNPYIATSSTVDANAPLGTLVIPVKTGTGSPATVKTSITVKNLKLLAATSSTTDLVASVEFFSPDAGVIVNTPGAASGNSASTPTVFTPYVRGGTKANTQLNTAGVQIGTGSLANQLLTSRLTTLGTPQVTKFASPVTSAKNADATKITVSSASVSSSSGSTSTDNVVTVTGSAGSVDNGAKVLVASKKTDGSTYDSVTITASQDGSFTAKLRGDCAGGTGTAISVSVTNQVSGTSTTSATKTATCGGGGGDEATELAKIDADGNGTFTISEVLAYISSNGGLAAVVSAGGAKLSAVIKAAKSALGLT